MVKSNSVITHRVNGTEITFTVLGAGQLVLDMLAVSEENRLYAAMYGLVQRVSDKAALSCDKATGKSATPQDKFEAMEGLVQHLNSGSKEWNMVRAGGGGAKVKVWLDEDIIEAHAAIGSVTAEEAETKLLRWATAKGQALHDYLQAAVKAKAIGIELARIERSRIVPTLDADEELAKFMAGDAE